MQLRRAWAVSSLSLAITYAVAFLTPINSWIGFWLRGPFYAAYQLLFVGIFLPCGVLLARRYLKRPRSLLAMTLAGAILGYLSGLIAFLVHPLVQPNGWNLFLDSLRVSTPEAAVAIAWFPVRLWSYLIGAMSGLITALILRFADGFQRKPAAHET